MRDMTLQEWIDKGEEPNTWFCRNRKTPAVLAGLFTGLVRQLYLDASVLYPGIRRWDPSGQCDNTLYVENSNIWKDNVSDPRPAIIVDIGDLMFDTRFFEGMDRRSYFDLQEGESHHERAVNGSVVFAHLGRNKGEAVNYASNTYDLFDAFSNAIKEDFCFDKLEAHGILRPRLRKTEPEDWECLFQLTFSIRDGYTVKTEAPKLKGFSIEAFTGPDDSVNI